MCNFIPNLGNNSLNIEKLMDGGYSILFKDGVCVIGNKKSG